MPADDFIVGIDTAAVEDPNFDGFAVVRLQWTHQFDRDEYLLDLSARHLTTQDQWHFTIRRVTRLGLMAGVGMRRLLETSICRIERAEIRRLCGWPEPAPPEPPVAAFRVGVVAPGESSLLNVVRDGAQVQIRSERAGNDAWLDVIVHADGHSMLFGRVVRIRLARPEDRGWLEVTEQAVAECIRTTRDAWNQPRREAPRLYSYGPRVQSWESFWQNDPLRAGLTRNVPPPAPKAPPALTTRGRQFSFEDDE